MFKSINRLLLCLIQLLTEGVNLSMSLCAMKLRFPLRQAGVDSDLVQNIWVIIWWVGARGPTRLRNSEFTQIFWVFPVYIQGVVFNWPPLNLLSVGRWVTDFKKTLESQTGPPSDRKTHKCLAKWMWFQHLESLGELVFLHLEGWKTTIYHIYALILQCSLSRPQLKISAFSGKFNVVWGGWRSPWKSKWNNN